MSTQNDADRNESRPAESPPSAPSDAELEKVERRIAELREQGIIGGDEGSRESLRAIAHVPGATARLIERRNRSQGR